MAIFNPTDLAHDLAVLVAPLYYDADRITQSLVSLAQHWAPALVPSCIERPDERTAYLITYGDAFRRDGEAPLRTLNAFLETHVGEAMTDVHLLPIYPWTSDDGFGVVDHRKVNIDLGSWDDVEALGAKYGLALDFVANHVSASSPWFQGWLADDPTYAGYFLTPGREFDTRHVTRPRTTPLTHDFTRPDGDTVRAWTTFGPDQVDVDPSTPAVLLDLTAVLLEYLSHGATTVRLDAIGYLWKQSGTTSIHLPQTHAIIQIWRKIVDAVAPGTMLLTETNVPHEDNITYFGNGTNEAHMIYQFALPPLVLHAFVIGRAATLATWAENIGFISPTATWFNFLASHDGIGLRPTQGILTDDDRALLVERVLARGGRVSLARQADGSQGVYELNTNFIDALVDPTETDPDEAAVTKGLASHALLLSLAGVPAIYYHSLLGSTQDQEAADTSGIPRRINRGSFDLTELNQELASDPRRNGLLQGILNLLTIKAGLPGLSPFARQDIEHHDDRVIVIRRAAGTPHEITAAINVSNDNVTLKGLTGKDVITNHHHDAVRLDAYAYVWLRREE